MLVLTGHLRHFVFPEYSALVQPNAFARLFYLATSLQQQAVIVFFALSGFLVGGKAFSDIAGREFVWRDYMLRRLTRLWIVMAPALAFTYIFDAVGDAQAGDERHSAALLVANLLFLQHLFVHIYGSNVPLWSLANEFWYYVLGPVVALIALGRTALGARLAGVAALAAMLVLFPASFLAGGLIWLAGALAAFAAHRLDDPQKLRLTVTRIVALALFSSALGLSKALLLGAPERPLGTVGWSDIALGAVVAITLPVVAAMPPVGGAYRRLAKSSSDISYTLYLTHYPLLIFLCGALGVVRSSMSAATGAAVYAGLLVVALFWAMAVWWCYERNTARIYRWIVGRMNRRAQFNAA